MVACGSDEETSVAPSISGIAWDTTEVTAGQMKTLKSAVTVVDPDGDVSEFQTALGPKGGALQEFPAQSSGGMDGKYNTSGGLQVTVGIPVAGTYELHVWMKDKAGHKSNVVVTDITAK